MKILLDECLPIKLKTEYVEYDVKTVQEMGWQGKSNGDLLAKAVKNNFDVFFTIDKNLKHQQNLRNYKICIIVLDVKKNTLKYLIRLTPKVKSQLNNAKLFEIYHIE